MSPIGERERLTQNRVVQLFQEKLGYTYLGNWEERGGNSNIEPELVRRYLSRNGYSETLISKTLDELKSKAITYQDDLYKYNKQFYELLRYGVKVRADIGENYETVWVIDWDRPEQNDFGIAEEVTISGKHDKRPDIVLFVNGIALGVLELKRSTGTLTDGIRQNITNQQSDFIQSFFTTVQFIFAGNSTEGLRYGSIGTPEKYYLSWKEDPTDFTELSLDKYLQKLSNKTRFLEIIHDFILFDAGVKKLCRPHQYFGVKAAQEHVLRKESGIIWHTQGSGKSLTMVWLARWILEHNPNARIAVITDRDELDKQIERVFLDAGESSVRRTQSGRELLQLLALPQPRILCSLIHKFGKKEAEDFEAYLQELQHQPVPVSGELFVFVDECHRTQSGKLHRTMKAMLPGAVFIGFTGTPLLKKDRETSLEVFGKYIHTYKFNEAVEDEIVKDLVYEARDIDQEISSQKKVDEWFETKTRGLNDFQKNKLKQKWGTMQAVLSSKSRMDQIVKDIVMDFNTKPRLSSGKGNAILVASSIYDACRYYELFSRNELRESCAIVTSYNPSHRDITQEDTGEATETEKEFVYSTYLRLLNGKSTEAYEELVKKQFIKEPARMKLLIVVDKLLTGFDAPPCTYLYIDKSMQDHGLFQAICRVNRLDSDDKQFGYIVDYKDLFKKVENAVSVYTSDLEYDKYEAKDVEILIKNRLEAGRQELDEALEKIRMICEPVMPPRDTLAYIRYFCGNPENPDDLKENEVKRVMLYRAAAELLRAYVDIQPDMLAAGYTQELSDAIGKEVDYFVKVRDEIKNASGENFDTKAYEADMRFLIDNYIRADESRVISPFGEDVSILDIIKKSGIADAIDGLPEGIKGDREAVAETIENNVRRKIIKEHLADPAYFEKMSFLLDEIIRLRKEKAIEYEEYLRQISVLVARVRNEERDDIPATLRTKGQRALYSNLDENEALALAMHESVLKYRQDNWRGNMAKENLIKGALYRELQDKEEVERIFAIIKQQEEY
jgi:type I restriction enzyme R subunit